MKLKTLIPLFFIVIHHFVYGQSINNQPFINKLDSMLSIIRADTNFTYFYPIRAHNYLFIEIDSVTNEKHTAIILRKAIIFNKKTDSFEYGFAKRRLKKCKKYIFFENKKIPVFSTDDIMYFSKKKAILDDGKCICIVIHKGDNKIDIRYIR